MNTSLTFVRRCSYQFNTAGIPVIKIPKYMEAEMKRHEARMEQDIIQIRRDRSMRGNRRVPIITSSVEPRLNHYLNQVYPKNWRTKEAKVPLLSLGWKRGFKHRNEEIIFKAYERKKTTLQSLGDDQITRFEDLQLNEHVINALASMGYHEATEVQAQAINEILSFKNVVCSAETGSGKTLAYLIPLLQSIFKLKSQKRSPTNDPMGLILVPSRELAEQVGAVLQKFASLLGIGAATMIGGAPKHISHTGYDVIVTTVGLLRHHLRNTYTLQNLKHLVLDEADTLLDDSFSRDVIDVLEQLHISGSPEQTCQLILVSATLPQQMKDVIGDIVNVDSMHQISTPDLHRVPSHIEQKFIRLVRTDRDAALLKLVKKEIVENRPVMIFSNRTPTSNWISDFLKENHLPCLRFNKTLGPFERLDQFEKFQCGDYDIISCTDLASRGLDTKRVKHVINFDCPHFAADYLHRCGRVGRNINEKSVPRVTTFVSFKPDVYLLQKLEWSVRMNCPIPKVDGNIKRALNQHFEARWQRKAMRK